MRAVRISRTSKAGISTRTCTWGTQSTLRRNIGPYVQCANAHVFTADDMLPVGSKVWNVAPSLTKNPGGKCSIHAVQLSIK